MASAPTIDPALEQVPVQPESSERGKRNPLRKTTGDILRSLAVVIAVVVALLVLTWRPQPDPVREVDPFPIASLAIREAGYRVLMPGVSEGWRSTSARLEPTQQSADKSVWFNGWVSPESEFFSLTQSHATHQTFIDEQTSDGLPADLSADPSWPWSESSGKNRSWTAYVSPDGDTKSLVKIKSDHATILTTTAEWSQLEAFADRLVRARKLIASRA
jgi:hypothetical protein